MPPPLPPLSDAQRRKRSEVANLRQHRAADDPELLAAVRDFHADRLADYAAEVAAKARPLTDEQLERVAALLRAGRAS